jgi:hypothetical protein
MKSLLRFFAVLWLVAIGCSGVAKAGDPTVGSWETFGNGPSHTGYYPATLGPNNFVADWGVDFTVPINQAVVADGRVYYTTNGYFTAGMHAGALNASTGELLWQYPLATAYSVNPPTYADGKLYFQRGNSSGDTHLWCLDAASGNLLWAAPHGAQWERYMAPVVVGDGAWVDGGTYGGMYGFNTADGSQRFFAYQDQYDEWTPSYYNGVVYSWVNGNFKAFDPLTGSVLWWRVFGAESPSYSVGSTIAILDNRAFFIGKSGVYALDLSTRSQAWFVAGTFAGTPAVDHSTVYAISGNSVLSYDATTGQSLGSYNAATALFWQPVITKDRVIAASSTATYIFDRASRTLLQTLPRGGYLSYAAGRLYVSSPFEFGTAGSISTYSVQLVDAEVPPEATPTPSPAPTATPTPTPQPSPTPAFSGPVAMSAAMMLPTGSSSCSAVASGDLNHDGRTDVAVVTNEYSNSKLIVFLQDAAGNLSLSDTYTMGSQQSMTGSSIATGDINGDGRDDVIAAGGQGLCTFLQSADGKLDAFISYPDANSSLRVAVGDFNSDGRKDVAALAWGTDQVSVFLQKRDGTLDSPMHYTALHDGYDDLKVGDVNSDGIDDIVVMSGQGWVPNFSVLTALRTGGFATTASYQYAAQELSGSVAIGDINGDGRNDIALSVWLNHDTISAFLQNAQGWLDRGKDMGNISANAMQFGDMDGDGRPDLVGSSSGRISIFAHGADGKLGNPVTYNVPYGSTNPHALALGDVNNDGALDVVFIDSSNLVVVLNKCITSSSLIQARVGEFFSYQLRASNGATRFEADEAAFNAIGLKFDGKTGQIYGTPLVQGTHSFTVQAVGPSKTGSGVIKIVVFAALPTPTPTATPLSTPEETPSPTGTPLPSVTPSQPEATPTPAPTPDNRDRVPPRVRVKSPTSRATPFGFVILSGAASDNRAVRRVEIRKGNGAYKRAGGRPDYWYQLLDLEPGRNVFFVRAVDTSGNVSRETRVVVTRN